MKVVQVTFAFDRRLADHDTLLDAYHTLTGWSDAVAAAGLEVEVVQAFSQPGKVRRAAVDYHFVKPARTPVLRFGPVLRAVVERRPDVVHVNGTDAAKLVGWLRRLLPSRTAIVVQHHAGNPVRSISPRAALMRSGMRAADGFLFTSVAQAAPWVSRGFIRDAAQVHSVLEASTSLVAMDRDEARRLCGMTGAPALLWVGRLEAFKDPITVLDGFSSALSRLPDATLTMVYGSAGLLPQIRTRLAQEPVLAGRVRLVAGQPHSEMARWYSAADLFVLGSRDEAAGYALIEACSCGLPPVVTAIPPFRAITGDGAIGALWSVGDAASCASALVSAASRAGNIARELVRTHYARELSWQAVGRRAREIYETVQSQRREADLPVEPA